MYTKAFLRHNKKAFALPTVLIASVIMLIVLVSALSTVTSIQAGLNNQYYERLANTAVESGNAMADYCLQQSGNVVTWSDEKPLRPFTDCSGNIRSGLTCNEPITDSRCVVLFTPVQTSFSVGLPTTVDGKPHTAKVQATAKQIGKTSKTVARTYAQTGYFVAANVSQRSWDVRDAQMTYRNTEDKYVIDNVTGAVYGINVTDDKQENMLRVVDSGVDYLIPGSDSSYIMFAMMKDGSVLAWSSQDGSYSQIGNGAAQINRHTPFRVSSSGALAGKKVKRVVTPAYGGMFNYGIFAILDDNTLVAWGDNSGGKLGLGDTTTRNTPVAVPVMSGVKDLVIGSYSAVALKYDGTIWKTNSSAPYVFTQRGANNITRIELTEAEELFAYKADNSVWSEDGTKIADNVRKVVGSQDFPGKYYVIKNDGTVQTKGYYNKDGSLGMGDINPRYSLTTIPGLSGVIDIVVARTKYDPGTPEYSESYGGKKAVLAITSGGDLYTWGTNDLGELGLGDVVTRTSPQKVTIPGRKFVRVLECTGATVGGMIYAILDDGSLWGWGQGNDGYSGTGLPPGSILSPAKISDGPVKSVAIAYHTGMFQKLDGTIWSWGRNFNGGVWYSKVPVKIEQVSITRTSTKIF